MPNNYFQFKQFTIHQPNSAMKVTTEACLLGSLLPAVDTAQHCIIDALDIGAGTGLLSLMYAQINPQAIIDAVEIDDGAFKDLCNNFQDSKFQAQLKSYHSSIFNFQTNKKYQLIFSNPPFFFNHLQSSSSVRNLAMHSNHLELNLLTEWCTNHLADSGMIVFLLPLAPDKKYEKMFALSGLHISKRVLLHQSEQHAAFRQIIYVGFKQPSSIQEDVIMIKQNGAYSDAFKTLLSPFYLKL